MYVHSGTGDSTNASQGAAGIFYQPGCTSCSAHDLTIHDTTIGVENQGVDDANVVYNSDIYDVNWGVQHQTHSGQTTTNFSVHDNHIHSSANWDDGGAFHHDLLFLFNSSAGQGNFNGVYIYNNLFDGPMGSGSTAHLYFGGGGQINTFVYNNVFTNLGQSTGLGNSLMELTGEATQQVFVYNNTVVGAGPTIDNSGDGCVALQGHITFINNAVTGCSPLVLIQDGTYGTGSPTIISINYNTYGQSGSTPWVGTSGGESSLAGWRSYTGGETNSTLNTGGLNLASNGSPNSGSPVLGAGTNRTSSCSATMEPLCSSTSDGDLLTVNARPPTPTPWDTGAYWQGGDTATQPEPPTGLVASVN